MQTLWTEIDNYYAGLFLPEDAVLNAAVADSRAAGLPEIAVAPNQGKLLCLLAKIKGARRILEIGTLGGYSTIWMARALPEDGKLIALELDPSCAAVAQKNIARAGLAEKVEIRVGPALETLAALQAEGAEPFDLIFIDADKENNPGYFERALALSKGGTLIIADNVVRQGAVLDKDSADSAVQGLRRMNDMAAAEPRIEATAIQTVGVKGLDGLGLFLVMPD